MYWKGHPFWALKGHVISRTRIYSTRLLLGGEKLWEPGCPERGGSKRIGRREKWPKKSWEEGEIGGKVRRREKMWGKRLGRREKLAQKVGRREIYSLVPPPPERLICHANNIPKITIYTEPRHSQLNSLSATSNKRLKSWKGIEPTFLT